MELVERRDPGKNPYGGRGDPAYGLESTSTINDIEPESLDHIEEVPNRAYGFRLLRRDS